MTAAASPGVAILLAAGRGARMRGAVDDKVLASLGGQPGFRRTLAAFVVADLVDEFVIVYRDAAQRTKLARVFAHSPARAWPVAWVQGGRERQDSVAQALTLLARRRHAGFVFIHDCARPLVHPESLLALDAAVRREGAACLAHRVTDTIKQMPRGAGVGARRRRLKTVDRARLWAMETPQAFAFDRILAAYREVQRRGLVVTDDAAALEVASRHCVALVENPHPNPKLTTPADFAYVEFLLAAEPTRT